MQRRDPVVVCRGQEVLQPSGGPRPPRQAKGSVDIEAQGSLGPGEEVALSLGREVQQVDHLRDDRKIGH